MGRKEGHMLKILGIIVVIFVVALFGIGIYYGAFSSVKIEKATTGPYKIACLDHIGPYKGICKKITNVKKLLDGKKVKYISACGMYYDDPKQVPSDKLRSKGGYLVEDIVKIEILENLYVPQREAVVAKIKAHPAVAAMKVYPKLEKWLDENNFMIVGPSLELYHDNGVIEVQMPIAPVKK